MGGDVSKPDAPVKLPDLLRALEGVAADRRIYFTLDHPAGTIAPEQCAVIGVLPAPEPAERMIVIAAKLNVRSTPGTQSTIVAALIGGDVIEIRGNIEANGLHWARIEDTGGYVAREFLKQA